jgi:AcrR family transcriptional regulator
VSIDGPSGEPHEAAIRRVGRPRSNPTVATGLEPREEILKVAAELFSARGYAATSTRLIADRVGLRQASLFHYFDRKEDILAELLDRTVRPAIAFSEWLEGQDVAAPVGLHALSWWDSNNLCSRPDNLAGLQLLHEARDERFAPFWRDRAQLRNRYSAYVADAGIGGPAGSEPITTELVFGLVESVLMWFERDGSASPGEVASAIAQAVLAIVGVRSAAAAHAARASARLRKQFCAGELTEAAGAERPR